MWITVGNLLHVIRHSWCFQGVTVPLIDVKHAHRAETGLSETRAETGAYCHGGVVPTPE